MREATDDQLAALAEKLSKPYECSCGVPMDEHCQECFFCPPGHEDMCGW